MRRSISHIGYMVSFLLFFGITHAQTKNYATMDVVSENTDNPDNAKDGDLATFASVRAYAGLALGIGAYSGYIELEFPTILEANTTSYVKIRTEVATILPALLSGGNGGYTGNVLIGGNQEFSVAVKDSLGAVVVSGDSQDAGELATIKLTVVINSAGEYFLRITPDVAYKRIRLTDRLGALLLGNTKRVYVHEAYYLSAIPPCNHPVYTNYSVSGSLTSTQATMTDPQKAVDADLATYSVESIAALSGGQSIQQTLYLESLSNFDTTFDISLSTTQALINAGIANNVAITAYNGATAVQTLSISQLLTLNSITMVGGQVATINMAPGAPIDRITLKITAVAGVAQTINFHNIRKITAVPVITLNNPVCQGSAASLIATTTIAGSDLKWYDSAGATNLLATTSTGQTFTTSALTSTVTYYVGVCEEFLTPVVVTVVAKPVAGVIEGDQTVCLTRQPGLLTSVSTDPGVTITYRWESSLDEATWLPVSGADTATYQPPVLLKSTFYRRITIITANGINCESVPSNTIKVTTKNCMVFANPMVRQRVKTGV